MAQFKSLAKGLNRTHLFDIDTTGFDYTTLAKLLERDGEGHAYTIRGAYINTQSRYYEKSPLLALDDIYVNLPQHQLEDVETMREDPAYVQGINEGRLGFIIESYMIDDSIYYKAQFVDMKDGAMI